MQYVTPSFARTTPEDSKVLAFVQDVCLGIPPTTVEVHPDWLMVRDALDPTFMELDANLAATVTGTPRLREDAADFGTVAVCNTTIYPLALVDLLLGTPFPDPIKAWNLITTRAVYLGLEKRVTPLLH